jgi:predicted DNA repair protein MutK
MAGASLLTLLDDIAAILDDVALMTKVAAKKTAGVLGDDLALNAEQVAGVSAERELPVVWAVAKGSFRNKLILVPSALVISAFIPWAIVPLLMIGGAFLGYEGFEKVAHKLLHSDHEEASEREDLIEALVDPQVDMVDFEKDKISGAVRTDFILSAEIIVISLGTVADAPIAKQIAVLSAIGVVMTVGVYGLVAAIVKLDDIGLWLARPRGTASAPLRALGQVLITVTPWLMKGLTLAGTVAMFLVGGGILAHGVPGVEPAMHHLVADTGPVVQAVGGPLLTGLFGVLCGGAVLAVVKLATGIWGKVRGGGKVGV